ITSTFFDNLIPPVSGLVNDVHAVGNARLCFWNNFVGTPDNQFAVYVNERLDVMLAHEVVKNFFGLAHIGFHRSPCIEATTIIQEIKYDLLFFVKVTLDAPAIEKQDFLVVECQVDCDGSAYEA